MAEKDVVFLLGAGASVDAGVPDTKEFVKAFLGSGIINKNEDLKQATEEIIGILKEIKNSGKDNKDNLDIESLLEILMKLEDRTTESLLKFYNIDLEKDFSLKALIEKNPDIIKNLISHLQNFIKEKAIIKSEGKIKYLEPFLGFVQDAKPLHIMSLNYDTCLEQFCYAYKLNYNDGFDVYWNPINFESKNTDVALYKLHGSVIWYRSDSGAYMKIPVMTDTDVKIITNETAKPLMLYPAQKFEEFPEPMLEMLVKVKKIIESTNTGFLVIVGYSFRDSYIKGMLFDAARKNRDLIVVIIDPNAYDTYHERLEYYNKEEGIKSSLYQRVVCLPYKFKDVFPSLKNYYLRALKKGINLVEHNVISERNGVGVRWNDCIRELLQAEYIEKIDEIRENKGNVVKDEIKYDTELSLLLPLVLGLNLSAGKQKEKAKEYFTDFVKEFKRVFIQGLEIIDLNNSWFLPVFAYALINNQPSYFLPTQVINFTDKLIDSLNFSNSMMDGDNKTIGTLKQFIADFKTYLTLFHNNNIPLNDYLMIRKESIGRSLNKPLNAPYQDSSSILEDNINNYRQSQDKLKEDLLKGSIKKIEIDMLSKLIDKLKEEIKG